MAAPERVVILGSGGFARETLGLLRDVNDAHLRWDFAGFVGPPPPDDGVIDRIDATVLGDDQSYLEMPSAPYFICAIADPKVRHAVSTVYETAGLLPASLIHPTAVIGSDVKLGAGTLVGAMAVLTTNILVGSHVHVDRGTMIGHDSWIDDFVTIHPACTISGSTRVSWGARLGTHSCILPGITVGSESTVGAGAVVTRDVEPHATVVGNPARTL